MEVGRLSVDDLLKPADPKSRRTKIIWTLGPAWKEIARLWEMLDSGMNVARLNFSHGDHKSHGFMVEKLREAK